MRFLQLILFIFMIHLSIAMVNALGVFHTPLQEKSDWFSDVYDNNMANESYVQTSVEGSSSIIGEVVAIVKGIYYFVKALALGIIAVPYTLGIFGLESPFTYLFSLPIYIMYIIGLAQLIRGTGTKGMD